MSCCRIDGSLCHTLYLLQPDLDRLLLAVKMGWPDGYGDITATSSRQRPCRPVCSHFSVSAIALARGVNANLLQLLLPNAEMKPTIRVDRVISTALIPIMA